MLTCKGCGVSREESEFYRNSTYKSGYATNQCRPCRVLYRRRHRERDAVQTRIWRASRPGYVHAINAAYYKAHKEENDARVREWRKSNPARTSEIEKRKYYKAKASGSRQEIMRRVQRDQYANNPEYIWRQAARMYVRALVKKGLLKKLPCEVCGDPNVEGHHHKGYEKIHWESVQWLCRKHHRQAEGKNYWG